MKTNLITKTVGSLIILQSIFPYSGIVSAMVAVEPTITPISCPLFSSPPPGACANGEWEYVGEDENGCPKPPLCVIKTEPEESSCPLYAMVMPTCRDDQTIVNGEFDENGCSLPPRCQDAIAITGTHVRVKKFDIKVEDYIPVTKPEISSEPILVSPSEPTNLISEPSTSYIVEPTLGCQENEPCETILIKRTDDNLVISDGNAMMSTSMPIQVENSQITITTNTGNSPVILPSLVKKIVEDDPQTTGAFPSTVNEIELTACASSGYSCTEHAGIYKVQSEKETKLFGLLPIMSTIRYEISASKGTILSTEKPWYLNIFSFLFTW